MLPYTHGIFESCHARSIINGIIIVTAAAATTMANCLTARSMESLVIMIKLVDRSIQALFRRSLDRL